MLKMESASLSDRYNHGSLLGQTKLVDCHEAALMKRLCDRMINLAQA